MRRPVTVGPAASARPRGSAPASASCARPLPAAPRPSTLRTPGPAAGRALSLPLPPREERAHAHCHAQAQTAEVKLPPSRPPPAAKAWLVAGAEQSRGRARRARGPPRPYPPCGGSSPTSGARPFPRTHRARGAEARPLPSRGHAWSRGRRGVGPSGQARACSAPRRCSRGDLGSPLPTDGAVGMAVTISAGDARTSEGRGERRETAVLRGACHAPSQAPGTAAWLRPRAQVVAGRLPQGVCGQGVGLLRGPCVRRRRASAAELGGGTPPLQVCGTRKVGTPGR